MISTSHFLNLSLYIYVDNSSVALIKKKNDWQVGPAPRTVVVKFEFLVYENLFLANIAVCQPGYFLLY